MNSTTLHIFANWKCHLSSTEGRRWFDRFAEHYQPQERLQVVVAPTVLSLEALAAHLGKLRLPGVALAVQDISPFPKGSYTGAVAADMITGMAGYAIVGHLERRRYFHETTMEVVRKVGEVMDVGLTPLICVDDDNAVAQLGALDDNLAEAPLIAYTPASAATISVAASPARVAEAVSRIRRLFPAWPILYGGGVRVDNVRGYLGLAGLSGVFVGAASLDPDGFASMCNQAARFLKGE
jgi:triosephosphate isomerase